MSERARLQKIGYDDVLKALTHIVTDEGVIEEGDICFVDNFEVEALIVMDAKPSQQLHTIPINGDLTIPFEVIDFHAEHEKYYNTYGHWPWQHDAKEGTQPLWE